MKILHFLFYLCTIGVLCVAFLTSGDYLSDLMLPLLPDIDSNQFWNFKNIVKSETVDNFFIKVPISLLNTLQYKLNKTILPPSFSGSKFRYGFNSDYLNFILHYWLYNYNWQEWEDKLNQFPHFITNINGLRIHFIHIRPELKQGQRSVPVLLLHGWPGSFFEFYKFIPMLTNITATKDIAYEIVCPSIPGFGWSEASQKPGFGLTAISVIMLKLMDRLNISDQFYVQGGDFGSLIAASMAKISPRKMAGIHVNMIQVAVHDVRYWLKLAVGAYLPNMFHFLTEEEQHYVYPYCQKIVDVLGKLGYLGIQATRPSTIGIVLSDSPAGLAAYIMEKFGAWSCDLEEHLNSDSGGIENITISKEEMLTNIMIYYVTNTIASSVRLYKEMFNAEDSVWQKFPVRIPVAVAQFPREVAKVPRQFAAYYYRDIRHFTNMPHGGHFAALEVPDLLVKDFASFIRVNEHRGKDN